MSAIGGGRLRHKFEDVDKGITEAALKFVSDSVIREGASCTIPHMSLEAAACTVRLPFERFSSQHSDVMDFVGRTLLDRHAQQWLEQRKAINWMPSGLSGQVAPLKTDGDGNCLAHAAGLAMWGLQDRSLTLRSLIHHALSKKSSAELLRPRWRLAREQHDAATDLGLQLDDTQWEDEWKRQIVDLASARERDAGLLYASLEQFHVFVLAQVLRRPIIVVANDVVEGFNGDKLQRLDMAGIYLPLLHRPGDCIRSPLMLAYFENHFVGLTWLLGPHAVPLCRHDGRRLPVLFLTEDEEQVVEKLLEDYLVRCEVTKDEKKFEIVQANLPPAQLDPPAVRDLAAVYAMHLTDLYKEDLQARCTTPNCRSYKRQGYDVCCSCSLRKARTPSPPSSPTQCINTSCDYFGDASRNGLCSVCYKKEQRPTIKEVKRTTPSTQQAICGTPGCRSTQILCKGFCSSCLDKMSALWLSQRRHSAENKKTASFTREVQHKPARSPSSLSRPCRNRDCRYYGNPDQAGFCSGCFKLIREAQLYQMSPSCRQNIPQELLSYQGWPGHV